MKSRYKIFILIILLFLTACAPKLKVPVEPVPKPKPVPEKVETGEMLFLRAEEWLQKEVYAEARILFEAYLSKYPAGALSDAALIKIADIHTILQNDAEARKAYTRLTQDFPDSAFVPRAMVGILAILYRGQQYDEVIDASGPVLEKLSSREHIFRIYVLLGDSYRKQNVPKEAVYAYGMALTIAKPSEREPILVHFKKMIKRLSSVELEIMIPRLEDTMAKGHLLYQLGLIKTGEEQYEMALKIFKQFVNNFADHENVEIARELIAELNKKLEYDRYTIGCLLPLSGRFKVFGQRALKGVELAFYRFNSRPDAPEFRIKVKDSASNPETAARAVSALSDDRIAAIIGPIITAESAAREAQDRGIPIITLTQKDHITELGEYVFRNFITPQMQVKTLATYAVDELGLKRFAILYPDEKYGTTFMNLFWDEVTAHRGTVVGAEVYNPRHTDFADPIKKLVGLYYPIPEDLKSADNPDNIYLYDHSEEEPGAAEMDEDVYYDETPKANVDFAAVFIPDSPRIAGLIIPQLAFYDIDNVVLLGTNLWHSIRLIEMARDYVQGAVMTEGFFSESALKEVQDFVGLFEKIYAFKPGFIEAVFYDTATIILEILSRPDIQFRSTIRDELKKLTNFLGVTGITSFSETGDASKGLYLIRVMGDKFVEVRYR